MIPDPPAPLRLLPDLQRLEVLVPRSAAWHAGVGVLLLVLLGLLAGFGLGAVTLGLLALLRELSEAHLLVLGPLLTLLTLAPAVAAVAALSVSLQHRLVPVRACRRGLSTGRDHYAWEIVAEIRADGDAVAIMLDDGSWLDVAIGLPPAAAWWLAASLGSVRRRALEGELDADGMREIRRAAERERMRPERSALEADPPQSATKPTFPWVPSQKGLVLD